MMNERIFELAKQADLIQWDTLPSGARTPDHESVVKARKFAELIVRQCADIAKHHVSNISTYSDAEFVDEQILEHFGVEE
jgi:hypothetical protein